MKILGMVLGLWVLAGCGPIVHNTKLTLLTNKCGVTGKVIKVTGQHRSHTDMKIYSLIGE